MKQSRVEYNKTHFSVSSPPQCWSQAVVCVSTPRMYPRSEYFLVCNYGVNPKEGQMNSLAKFRNSNTKSESLSEALAKENPVKKWCTLLLQLLSNLHFCIESILKLRISFVLHRKSQNVNEHFTVQGGPNSSVSLLCFGDIQTICRLWYCYYWNPSWKRPLRHL